MKVIEVSKVASPRVRALLEQALGVDITSREIEFVGKDVMKRISSILQCPLLVVEKAYDEDLHPRDEKGRFTYHGTQADISSIQAEGLKPNEYGNPLNFHDIESSAADYAGSSGNLLRVDRSNLPKHKHDTQTSRRWTQGTVPPEHLEIKTPGGWKPLSKFSKAYDEAQHPRDEKGQWTDLGGVVGSGLEKPGPIKISAFRTGGMKDAGRGVFFGDSEKSVAPYSALHGNAPVVEYEVSAKNPLVTQSQFTLHQALYPGKTFQDAVWLADKASGFKSSIEASRKVEARMASKARAMGHDAIIYTSPPAPAKHELAIINPKTASFSPKLKKAFNPDEPRDKDGQWTDGGGGSDFTTVEQSYIDSYTEGGLASGNLNTALRKGGPLLDEMKTQAAALDKLVEKRGTASPQSRTLWRGLAGYTPEELGLKEGKTFTDPGFASTSEDKKVAMKFALAGEKKLEGEAVALLFKISVPAGHKVVEMDSRSNYEEKERLLARGTKFEVTNIAEGAPGEKPYVVSLRVKK